MDQLIERGVAPPVDTDLGGRPPLYPFEDLGVGDRFWAPPRDDEVEAAMLKRLKASAGYHTSRGRGRYRVYLDPGRGAGCWVHRIG
jgi:hypothetical protein